MPTLKQVKAAERGLSPKQIALLYIQESRRHPSLMAMAEACAAQAAPVETLCGRIEASLAPEAKGRSRADHNRAVRNAQRDGVFLARLALECSTRVVGQARERRLEIALLATRLVLIARGADKAEDSPSVWLTFGERCLRDMEDSLAAVRLIEREYFDSSRVLHRDDEAELLDEIDAARRMVHFVRAWASEDHTPPPKGGVRKPSGAFKQKTRGAVQRAESMVVAAKYRVLYDLGEHAKANQVLDAHLARNGLMQS